MLKNLQLFTNIFKIITLQINRKQMSPVEYLCPKGHNDIIKIIKQSHLTLSNCYNILHHLESERQCTLKTQLCTQKHFIKYLQILVKSLKKKQNPVYKRVQTMLKMLIQTRNQFFNYQVKSTYTSKLQIKMTDEEINKSIKDINSRKISLPFYHLNLQDLFNQTNNSSKSQDQHQFLRVFCAMLNQGSGSILTNKIKKSDGYIQSLKKQIIRLYKSKISPTIQWQEYVNVDIDDEKRLKISINLQRKLNRGSYLYNLQIQDEHLTYFICSEGKKNFHSYIYTNQAEIKFFPMENLQQYMILKVENKNKLNFSPYLFFKTLQLPFSTHIQSPGLKVWLIHSQSQIIMKELQQHLKKVYNQRSIKSIKTLNQVFSDQAASNFKYMALLYTNSKQNLQVSNSFSLNQKNKNNHSIDYKISLLSRHTKMKDGSKQAKQYFDWAIMRCNEVWGKSIQFISVPIQGGNILRFNNLQQCLYVVINFISKELKSKKKGKQKNMESLIQFYYQY